MSSYNSKVIKAPQVKIVGIAMPPEQLADKEVNRDKLLGKETDVKSPTAETKIGNNREIELLKRDFEKRTKALEKAAYDRGISDGVRIGEDKVRNESLKGINALESQLREVAALKRGIIAKAEKEILSLSIAIAERILHHEITSKDDSVQFILQAALKDIMDRENIKIRMHPHDFQYITGIKDDFLRGFDGIKNIVFEQDVGIIRGGAIIETQFGEVDARIDRQLAEVKNQLLGMAD